MEWEEEWNKGMRDIYMQTCLGGIENVENIVGGGKCMEECANRLSRTKFCGNKTVTEQVVWRMGRREMWWKCKKWNDFMS